MIPGLERATFERLGQVHRNSFVNAPMVLDERLRLRRDQTVTLAGQLSGVEGYVESIGCGLAAGLFVAAEELDLPFAPPPPNTALGGLLRYLTIPRGNFQPSNVIWMMIDTPKRLRKQGKRPHREAAAQKALLALEEWKTRYPGIFDTTCEQYFENDQ